MAGAANALVEAVIEVNDSDRLEQALERMTAAIRQQANANAAHSITIEPSDADGQRYYSSTTR